MPTGTCHCGAIRIDVTERPQSLIACNCSICRRNGALWALFVAGTVRVSGHPEHTTAYVWGAKTIKTMICSTCGRFTHWESLLNVGAMNGFTRAGACVIAWCSASCLAADAKDLVCRPSDSAHWVESIRISPSQNKVWLKLKQYTWTTELPLLYVGPDQVEQPIYAFNDLPDGPTDEVINAFKVFRVGKTWRLIDAGLEPRQGTFTLRAIGRSEELECTQLTERRQ